MWPFCSIFSNTKNLLFEHHANPNVIIPEHNIAPIHYAAGMENEDFADAAMKLMLKCKGTAILLTFSIHDF